MERIIRERLRFRAGNDRLHRLWRAAGTLGWPSDGGQVQCRLESMAMLCLL
jgi:hypothetical protein